MIGGKRGVIVGNGTKGGEGIEKEPVELDGRGVAGGRNDGEEC